VADIWGCDFPEGRWCYSSASKELSFLQEGEYEGLEWQGNQHPHGDVFYSRTRDLL
jgi:hypothetical protein